jgi:hypothetical protein
MTIAHKHRVGGALVSHCSAHASTLSSSHD